MSSGASGGNIRLPLPDNTLFGHPTGLFTLFFAEMWERFSYYGMRALLVFYMIKGFLGYGDSGAYEVYGAYTALVYMTPFFGGLIADRLLGARRAVIVGGLLMAAGHLMMRVESNEGFFFALALLIAGNGFFKPNISTMVGGLYPQGSQKRDGGFTIFYMGINLGAAMSPLLCGYIGETYGWHYGFGLATVGMLTGIAVFVAPSVLSQSLMFLVSVVAAVNIFVMPRVLDEYFSDPAQIDRMELYLNFGTLGLLTLAGVVSLLALNRGEAKESMLSTLLARLIIMSGAVAGAVALFLEHPESPFFVAVNIGIGIVLLAAGGVAWVALGRGGLPAESGSPPPEAELTKPIAGPITSEWMVYLLTLVAIPVLALIVSGGKLVPGVNESWTIVPASVTEEMGNSDSGVIQVLAVLVAQISTPAGLGLMVAFVVAFGYLVVEAIRLPTVPRHRMYVVFILTFFSLLFWAFFEQAGSSVNNFTDRNVDRVLGSERTLTEADLGKTITLQPTQEQLGYHNGEDLFTLDQLDSLRDEHKDNTAFTIEWVVAPDNVGREGKPPMEVAERESAVPASWFQTVNPSYILIFGLVFTALWTYLGSRGLEPSTPVKFSLGLIQLGLGFGAFYMGAQSATDRGMVALYWLFLGYLLQTTGELCLSPVGLSMVTRMSPARLVSTVMGAWFLATAVSQFLAAIIAQFTGVGGHGGGDESAIPPPSETVHVYGGVFGKIALTAMISGGICLLLSPLIKYWMHEDEVESVPKPALEPHIESDSTRETNEGIQKAGEEPRKSDEGIQKPDDRFTE